MAEKKTKKRVVTISLSEETLKKLKLLKSRSKFIDDFLLFVLKDLDDRELLELLSRMNNDDDNNNAFEFLLRTKFNTDNLKQFYTYEPEKKETLEEREFGVLQNVKLKKRNKEMLDNLAKEGFDIGAIIDVALDKIKLEKTDKDKKNSHKNEIYKNN